MINPSKPTWMRGRKPFYGFCPDCLLNMAAVPQGAFAAKKVRKNEEKRKEFHYTTELNPMNYSSKYMNSIWGQYNRYSVHNLKKIMDDGVFAMSVGKGKRSTAAAQPVEKPTISTDLGPVGSAISFSSNKIYN